MEEVVKEAMPRCELSVGGTARIEVRMLELFGNRF